MAWGGGRGGKDKTFPWGALGWVIPPQGCPEWSERPMGQHQAWPTSVVFQRGTVNVQGFLCAVPQAIPEISIPSTPQPKPVPHHCSLASPHLFLLHSLFPFPLLFPSFCFSSLAKPERLPGFWSPALTVCGQPQTNSV